MKQNDYVKHLLVYQTFKLMCIICTKLHNSNRFSFKPQAHFTLKDLLATFPLWF